MDFRKFAQNKLWRDKLVEKVQKDGSRLIIKKLNDKEFSDELKTKLLEEANDDVWLNTK